MGLKKTSDLSKPSFGKLQIVVLRLFRILSPLRKVPLRLLLVDSHPAPPFGLWVKQSPNTHQPGHSPASFVIIKFCGNMHCVCSRENGYLLLTFVSSALAEKSLQLPPERLNF